MSAISNNDIAHAIYLASKDHPHEGQSLFFSQVVQFLFKKRLLAKSPDILSRLSKIINEHNGRIVAKISSKDKIDEITKKELIQTLASRYSAKEVIMVENLDDRLLGGFKVEINDEVIDLTIRNKMEKLQEYLTQSA